ncbi:hypothetical protein CIT292_09336 [Citrobacter youngae ATCC 29220]|uniref:Uncharacterized protein n=1 Tax=Citrobacter youngae ATCC 29220 TaxID=500640 RepID=D4BEX0_9ENTR|nr:hypothetical protein CIT292_09336 [Citrobacter youngae ATCC 29220]
MPVAGWRYAYPAYQESFCRPDKAQPPSGKNNNVKGTEDGNSTY